jgi:hypothetical protein
MKPQREGGGHNIYNSSVAIALGGAAPHDVSAGAAAVSTGDITKPLDPEELAAYILMQRIFPKPAPAVFVRGGAFARAAAICELGVYTTFLSDGAATHLNAAAGHLLRTKIEGTDEGGVAAGFAVLDSPLLIDE